jgi:hypothetical protein
VFSFELMDNRKGTTARPALFQWLMCRPKRLAIPFDECSASHALGSSLSLEPLSLLFSLEQFDE